MRRLASPGTLEVSWGTNRSIVPSNNSKTELRAFVWTASLEKSVNSWTNISGQRQSLNSISNENFSGTTCTLRPFRDSFVYDIKNVFGTNKKQVNTKSPDEMEEATENSPFKAFSDKKHRAIAQQIAQISDDNKKVTQLLEANREIKQLLTPERNQGVLLLYPIPGGAD